MYSFKVWLMIISIILIEDTSCFEENLLFTAMQEFGLNHPISIKSDKRLYVELVKQLHQNGKYTNLAQEDKEICTAEVKNQFQVIIKDRRSTLVVLKDLEFSYHNIDSCLNFII